MASEVISHAIFASSHPTSPRTAPSSTPPPTPRFAPHLALHLALHSTLHPTLRSPAPTPHRIVFHSASHPALRSTSRPALPPYTPSCASPSALTPIPHHPFPSHFFAPQDSFSQVPPSTSLHLSPIRVSPSSVFLSQAPSPRTSPRIPSCPSPCAPTPFHTTHFPSASLYPPCSSAKPSLWIFSCVKRPGSLTT